MSMTKAFCNYYAGELLVYRKREQQATATIAGALVAVVALGSLAVLVHGGFVVLAGIALVIAVVSWAGRTETRDRADRVRRDLRFYSDLEHREARDR